MKILLDMDEVLVDFIGGACKVHGITLAQLRTNWEPGEWSIVTPMGKFLGWDNRPNDVQREMYWTDLFWKPIHEAGSEFWRNLEPLPNWMDVWELCAKTVGRGNLYIVSAPSKETCSYTGKVEWIKEHLSRSFDRFFLTPHKGLLAAPDRLLVDDRASNIRMFQSNGGMGVLFPSWGNGLYGISHSSSLVFNHLRMSVLGLDLKDEPYK